VATISLNQDVGNMAKITSFKPLVSDDARVLILGSMPSEVSLQENQYYAHPRNSFWFIMGELFGFKPELDYHTRTAFLIKKGVSVWDVLRACFREGSLDSAIQDSSVVVNDFESFLLKYQHIKYIFFNGARAEQLFNKYVLPTLPATLDYLQYQRLPSTSPAHAAMRPEEKLSSWGVVKDKLTEAVHHQ